MALQPWNEIPYAIRVSKRKLYEYVRTNISEEEPNTPTPDPDPEQPEEPTTTDIAVSVTDGTDPVGNIDVVLTDTTDNTKTYTAKSGNAGGCTLSNVAFGTYTVTATGEGYENYTGAENLTVTAETTSLSITVTASTPDPEQPEEEVPGGE